MRKIQIIGNLGRDAETKNMDNGKHVINFSVAVTEKNSNGSVTNWFTCGYWTDKIGISQYLKKGTQVFIEGKPDVRAYTDKDGNVKAEFKILVNNIQLLGGKREDEPQQQQPQPQMIPANNVKQELPPLEDLPW